VNLKRIFLKVFRYAFSSNTYSLIYKNSNLQNNIKQPKNISRADCFVVEEKERLFLFFEEWEGNDKAHISVGEFNTKKLELENVEKILVKDYHLSYPNILKYKSDWYLIPESHENKSVELYKFSKFPYKVKKVRTLLGPINAADTTTIIYKNTIYFFTSLIRAGSCDHSDDLSLFFCDDLLNGKLIEHPMSPIKKGKKLSRMAGAIIRNDKRLLRYSQDCSVSYGETMNIFEVTKLSKKDYEEKFIETLKSPKRSISFHTFAKSKEHEFYDVIYITYNPLIIMKNIFNLVLKMLRN